MTIAKLVNPLPQSINMSFVGFWQNVVSEYSKCRLTFDKDKLPAVVGVAKRIMEHTADRYVDGMWESTVLYDLAWFRIRIDRDVLPTVRTFRAPSWSWVSVDGQVSFPSTFGGIQDHFAAVQNFPDFQVDGGMRVTRGSPITLNGVCLPLSIKWAEENITSFEVAGFSFSVGDDPRGAKVDLEDMHHAARTLERRRRILLMPVFSTHHALFAILLAKIRGVGAHVRVGAVQIEVMFRGGPRNSRAGDHGVQDVSLEADGWMTVPSAGHDEFGDYVCNTLAMRFMMYVKKSRCRTVDIF
jgi:hypothetical protein